MTTLHERLQEAVNERLRIAEAAIGEPVDESVPWTAAYDPPREVLGVDAGDEWWVRGPNGHTVALCGEDYTQARQHAEHIAANDPARIIRDCQRDLRVLELHGSEPHECPAPSDVWGPRTAVEPVCRTIQLLAEAYQIDGSTT